MVKLSRSRLLSRRQALNLGISAITALTILSLGRLKVLSYVIYPFTNQRKVTANRERTFKVIGKNSLKQRAQARGLIYGAYPQANLQNFDRDPKLKSSFIRECSLVVAGFYWDATRPNVSIFDFTETDYFANFAATNKLLLRGHPLVWHSALPKWLKSTINHQNAERILTDHIQTVVKRYAGKMHSWDVVNEAIDLGSKRSDNLTNSPWLEFLGPDYIDLAFRIAARSDPKALLVYNETNLENEAHRTAVFKLLKHLKSKGTPIHAFGVQSHLSGDFDGFNLQKFRKFLRNVANLGLKIMVTELDVTEKNLPMEIDNRDRIVAGVYEDYLTTILAEKAVIAVINWGFTDRYTWITDFAPRPDKSEARPLPFDRDLNPKLAWNAIARAFDRSPKR